MPGSRGSDSSSTTSSPKSGRKQIDLQMIEKENMERLQVYAYSTQSSKSLPNSPMLRRVLRTKVKEKEPEEPKLEDYFPRTKVMDMPKNLTQQKNPPVWKQLMHEEKLLSKSWNEPGYLSPQRSPQVQRRKTGSGSPKRSLSPALSNSPSSVGSNAINAHYLMNTSGRPGSFMLKKSEEILDHKSPQLPRSKKLPPLQPIPASIIISPPTENASIGFNVTEDEKESGNIKNGNTKTESTLGAQLSEEDVRSLQKSITVNVEDIDLKPEKSMFSPLKKVGPFVIPAEEHSIIKTEVVPAYSPEPSYQNQKARSKKRSTPPVKPLPINLQKAKQEEPKSQGMLTPPLVSKGSQEFYAMLEKQNSEKEAHRMINSYMTSTKEESENDDNEVDQEVEELNSGLTLPVVLPPVFSGSPVPMQVRNFEEPIIHVQSEENWNELQKCRYLRLKEDQASTEDVEVFEQSLGSNSTS